MAKTEKETKEIEENYNPKLEEKIRQEQNKGEDITFIQVKFGLNFTEDELLALANEPHSKLAVRTKKYIYQCIKYAAEKYIKENVTKA